MKLSAFLLLRVLGAELCKEDRDCWSKSRPDTHSLYCIDSKCLKILPPGAHCERPTDCASFFYFGPLACGAGCRIENECENLDTKTSTSRYCCRSIPDGGECLPNRPSLLSGCDLKHSCIMNAEGKFTCASRNLGRQGYGVVLSILGNIVINIGINLQKRSYFTETFEIFGWFFGNFAFGVAAYAAGKVLSFSAYIFGNQSLLASLSAFGLIANSVFAPLINHEMFTRKDFAAIFLVFTGSSVIVMNAGGAERVLSLCQLMKMYKKTEVVVWLSFLLALMAILYASIKYVEANSDWALPGGVFSFLKCEEVFFEENGVVLKYLMMIFYTLLSAMVAVFTSLFAKSFGEIVEKTIVGENQFLFVATYVFFGLLVCFTCLQIYWLNMALRHYDALLVLPIFHAMWTVLSILNAGIYFSDFEHYDRSKVVGFAMGLGTIFTGTFFLASRVCDKNRIEVTAARVQITVFRKEE